MSVERPEKYKVCPVKYRVCQKSVEFLFNQIGLGQSLDMEIQGLSRQYQMEIMGLKLNKI